MPYIETHQRAALDASIKLLNALTPGQLNYVISSILLLQVGNKPSYTKYNELIGVLECVKLEMYRRAVAPYEDSKIEQNGDIGYVLVERCGCSSKNVPGAIIQVNVCDKHKVEWVPAKNSKEFGSYVHSKKDPTINADSLLPDMFIRPDDGSTSAIKHHSGCTNPYCVGCVDDHKPLRCEDG